MKVIETSFEGLYLIENNIHIDERGYFMESYKSSIISKLNPKINFIQENLSMSKFGVLRGLHFQKTPFQQTKLVRVIKGEVQDVVVDLRRESKTYGKHMSFIFSENDSKQLLIPKGFAHGFLTLSKYSIFSYMIDNKYSVSHESGIYYDDKDLGIKWNLNKSDIILSGKDKKLNHLTDLF